VVQPCRDIQLAKAGKKPGQITKEDLAACRKSLERLDRMTELYQEAQGTERYTWRPIASVATPAPAATPTPSPAPPPRPQGKH
jgi:hypothetical protein